MNNLNKVLIELLEKTSVLKQSFDDGLDHRHGVINNCKNIMWFNDCTDCTDNKSVWWTFGSACCMNSGIPEIICDRTIV